MYSPLELLLFVAGCCTIADSFVPQLLHVPKSTVTHVVRAVLSTSFVLGAGVVVYNLKSRFCKEQAWQCEMQGDVTSQRRWEAYDKLGTFAIYVVSFILVIQVGRLGDCDAINLTGWGWGWRWGRGGGRVNNMELLHSPVVACAVHGTCCGSLLTPCCIWSTTSVQRLQYHVCSSAPHPRRPPPPPLVLHHTTIALLPPAPLHIYLAVTWP